jgi:hypothetical protein
MMSYSWDQQEIIKRIAAELQRHKYIVWLDVEQMHGNIADRMADAVEGAELIMYGCCPGYRESANCVSEFISHLPSNSH